MLIITNTVVMAWAALILIRHWWELTGRKLEQGLPVCLILGSLSYIYLNLAKLING